MNKYQLIVLGVALIAGVFLGSAVTSHYKEKQLARERQEAIEHHKKHLEYIIEAANGVIGYYQHKQDSLMEVIKHRGDSILLLEKQIKIDGVRVEQKRKEVGKLNSYEKVRWLVNRYRPVPKS